MNCCDAHRALAPAQRGESRSPLTYPRWRGAVFACLHLTLAWVALGWSPLLAWEEQQQNIVDAYFGEGLNVAQHRKAFQKRNSMPFERLQRVCQLEPAQKEEIALAMRGDFARFFRELDR